MKKGQLMDDIKILARRKENYQKLMNEENTREGRNEQQAEVAGAITLITLQRLTWLSET